MYVSEDFAPVGIKSTVLKLIQSKLKLINYNTKDMDLEV